MGKKSKKIGPLRRRLNVLAWFLLLALAFTYSWRSGLLFLVLSGR